MTQQTARRHSTQLEQLSSTRLLAVNLVVTHGGILALVGGAAVVTAVPVASFGSLTPTPRTIVVGIAVGCTGYVLTEGLVVGLRRVGVQTDRQLTAMFVPQNWLDGLFLGGIALPVAAAAEELLYRGAVIGALTVGIPVPEWVLLFGSAVAFGFSHALQGPGGIFVAFVLGLLLGGTFVATGSLFAVALAHYLINVLEIGRATIQQ